MSRHTLIADAERLLNAEHGAIRKEAPFRFALVYPSPYRAAMSSLGFQLIYREINGRADWAAERSFLPEDVAAYKEARVPLFTFEGLRPVNECHVIGFSLAYELEVLGVIGCLELSGLAPLAADRHENDPLVVIGGPLTFSNPVPAGPFADVIVMGEGEALIHDLLQAYEDTPEKHLLLPRLARIPGLYVPAIHGEKLFPVVAADNARLPAFAQIISPNTELRNMFLVEAERGCHRQCTYCVMRRSTNGGMRLAEEDRIIAAIPEHAERVGLVGAAVSDHPRLIPIARAIVDSGRGIGLSSLRADRLTTELMEVLALGGYRTLTVSSDGVSERMRKQLGKNIRERHLVQAAEYAREHKMRLLKVYMMVGVPDETDEDIDELIRFQKELSKLAPVAMGIAPFVAKRNTPLDRTPFGGVREVNRTLKRITKELGRHIDVRSASSRWAWVEWCMAQGGFDMADAALAAYHGGGGFGAWKRGIKEHMRAVQPPDDELRGVWASV